MEPWPAALCRSFKGPRCPADAEGIDVRISCREESGWQLYEVRGRLRMCLALALQLPKARGGGGAFNQQLQNQQGRREVLGWHRRR